jgi:hypothetical protein
MPYKAIVLKLLATLVPMLLSTVTRLGRMRQIRLRRLKEIPMTLPK